MYNTSVETASIAYGSNYLPLMSSGRRQHQQQSFNDTHTALILEEAEKLYDRLIIKLRNDVITAAASIRASLFPSDNNQSEIYNNDQEQSNHSNGCINNKAH